MSDLIPFSFENHSIRVLTDENGEPLFVAKDIAVALGYANTSDAISTHCKGVAERYPLQTKGGTHSSPRVHLRRGHIRNCASGVRVWVQPCVVGSKHGMIHKDYRLVA